MQVIWSLRRKQPVQSRAEVRTDTPERFAKQLASHLGHRVTVEATPDGDLFRFTEGQGLVRVGEGVIVLEAQAPGEKALQVVQNVLGGHLARFGERAGLAVTWSPAAPVA